MGAVPFPKHVARLKKLGVGGVITLNESFETLVPPSLYQSLLEKKISGEIEDAGNVIKALRRV
ncbi:Phosphatidylglycerophosphate phosphatase ptpmt2 [Dionaea muscipula]